MTLLNGPLVVASTVVFAVLLGLAAQRLLGVRLGPVRLLATGLFATAVLPLLARALLRLPDDPSKVNPQQEVWFALLAAMCTLLASMVFIVVIEAFAPLGSVPPAAVWGRGLRGRWSRSRRTWQVVGLALRHGFGPYLRGRRSRVEAPGSHATLGRALRDTLNAGGVTFVKLGQVLSTRAESLPPDIADELALLRDAAAPVPAQDVERVVREELGAPLETFFSEFDPVPLAAASIGQVHAARLLSGEDVVVKVQRPGIRRVVERDLDIAVRLGERLERTTEWGRAMGTRALAEGLARAIREELDYRIEAGNILAVNRALGTDATVRLPVPHRQLSTSRVLVMSRFHGSPVSDAGALMERLGLDPADVARTILDALLRQIMVEGIFHADPHAGNIFLLDDGTVGFLDFGSVGRLDTSLREALGRLLLGFHRNDPLAITDALLEFATSTGQVDQQQLERDIGRLSARYSGGAVNQGARMLTDLFDVVSRHRLEVPGEIAAVFRSIATVEGTLRQLSPDFELVAVSKELARGYLTQPLQPSEVRQAAGEELLTLLPILRRLPRRIERVTDALEHGRLNLNLRLFADERDRNWLTVVLHNTLLTALAGVLGLMATLLLGLGGGPDVRSGLTLNTLIGYNLLVVSAILGVRVLAQIFRGRA